MTSDQAPESATEEPAATALGPVSIVDTGNRLLAPDDITMDTGVVTAENGVRYLVWTFRTKTTTFTLHLDEQAVEFVKNKGAESFVKFAAAGRSGLVVARGVPNGLGLPASRGGY